MLNKERNYGIDALRIISMFMVLVLHILGGGGILEKTKDLSLNYTVSWFLEIAAYCAVNCYAIISGYVGYGRKIKYSNLIYLIFCALYYMIILTTLGYFIVPNTGLKDIARSLLHMRTDGWWYVKSYFCAFLFFPHINFIVEKYEEKRLYLLAGGMFVFFSIIPTLLQADVFGFKDGYSPWWLMIMYFTGAVIKKYDIGSKGKKIKYLFMYVAIVLLTFISKIGVGFITQRLFNRVIFSDLLVSYISPTIIFSAIFLVLFFKNIKLNNFTRKIVAVMSPLTFGVYLSHTQYFPKNYLKDRFIAFADMSPLGLVASVILTALFIYLLCSLVDYIREIVFRKMKVKNISEQIENNFMIKYNKVINKNHGSISS